MNKKCLLVMLLTMLALVLAGCSGEKATKGEYFTYIVETDGTATITGYIGNEKAVIIPKKIDGHKVCRIEKEAFASNSLITTVTLQKGIQSIGMSAFSGCENLTDIILPDTVESIGGYAFKKTSITSITIPEGIHGIGIGTFAYCSRLKEINLPSSIAYIDDEAFYSCKSLKEIVIPDFVHSIGDSAFCYCTKLTTVTMPLKINASYLSFATIGDYAFANCESLQTFVVPEGIYKIGAGAFKNCSSLREITIPESVTGIQGIDSYGNATKLFYGCNIEKIYVKEDSYAAGIMKYDEKKYYKELIFY